VGRRCVQQNPIAIEKEVTPNMSETSPAALLLYPPLTDPTAPYHSLVYVASCARQQGFLAVEVCDTNIEALNYCARPDVLCRMMQGWEARRHRLSAQPSLSKLEQIEYCYLVRAQALEPQSPGRAISVLKDPEAFYDYSLYRDAVRQIELWLNSLSCDAFPGQFVGMSLTWAGGLFNTSSEADLTNEKLLERVVGPFREYFCEVFFPELRRRQYDLIGINVTYTSQLPYALWLVRKIREILPDSYLVCGGTEVSDIWKYVLNRDSFARIFREADACVVGEGETAFVRILESLSLHRRPSQIPNVVSLDRQRGTCTPPPTIVYEDLDLLPTPEYRLMSSESYFSPHLFHYYSPTRGCYWNKCTFCDYGLNFGTPTSPWRQRSIELVVRDLQAVSQITPYVYLSVDVLAPGALLKLAQAIIDAKVNIRWAAEMRLEKYFNKERCETLQRSGCLAVSVGFESGSQRILDQIQKGTKLDQIEITLKEFNRAGIAVQMMGFTGFPTESYGEAMESILYLKRNSSHWTVGGLGDFVLTPGAIVAQRPADFNISNVRPFAGNDINRYLNFDELPQPSKTPEEKLVIKEAKRQLDRVEFNRPFAGGTDSAHSIFYYNKYGLAFPLSFIPSSGQAGPFDEDVAVILNGKMISNERYDLLSLFDSKELDAIHEKVRFTEGIAFNSMTIKAELEGEHEAALPIDGESSYLLSSDGVSIPCSFELLDLLVNVDGARTIREIIAAVCPQNAGQESTYSLLARAMWEMRVIMPKQRGNPAFALSNSVRESSTSCRT